MLGRSTCESNLVVHLKIIIGYPLAIGAKIQRCIHPIDTLSICDPRTQILYNAVQIMFTDEQPINIKITNQRAVHIFPYGMGFDRRLNANPVDYDKNLNPKSIHPVFLCVDICFTS
jgi:hypothetical protein